MMSRRERECMRVLDRVKRGEIKLREGSEILRISYRQCRRKYKRYLGKGDEGLVHVSRGKPSNRRYGDKIREKIISKYQERFWDFGPTLAAEKLSKEGPKVDHETLRRWLIKEGTWQVGRKRPRHRSWRPRRSHRGELVQMDGSHHPWFEDRGEECCLMNMVDDATGETLSLFDQQETTEAAMRLLWMWIDKNGIPAALYTDRKNVYVPDEKAVERAELRGEPCLTQFGRACKELGIRIIEAHSPQAKGRVERSNGTYQDRLVKELRLENISDIETANKFLQTGFLDELNARFKVDAAEKSDFHRSKKGHDLKAIFCIEEERSLTDDWIVRFENNYYQVKRQSSSAPTTRKVRVRRYLNGELHMNYRGKDMSFVSLPGRPTPARHQARSFLRAGGSKLRIPPPHHGAKPYIPPADHPWRQSIRAQVARSVHGKA